MKPVYPELGSLRAKAQVESVGQYTPFVDPPKPKQSPINVELDEIAAIIENLTQQHFHLADHLRTVYPCGVVVEKKTVADGVAQEPSTGCELKDQLAELKQRLLYLFRLQQELDEKLWI